MHSPGDSRSSKSRCSIHMITAGLYSPLSSFATVLTVVPHSSGFRGSRFRNAQNLCARDHRYPDFRLADERPPVGPFADGTNLLPCVLSEGWSRLCRDFGTYDVLFLLTLGTLISRLAICRLAPDFQHLSLIWTVPIPSGFRDFRSLVSFILLPPDPRNFVQSCDQQSWCDLALTVAIESQYRVS